MQAARGTSLSRDDSTPGALATPAPRAAVRAVFVLVFAVLFTIDQVTKHLAVAHLTGQPDKQLVGDLLQLHLTRNPGAAFSTGVAYTELFTCLAIAAVLVVLWLSLRLGSYLWAAAFGLLLAGVGGNLVDRLFREPGVLRGHVVDFLMLPNWPIFNVADMCINVAAALILVQAFRGIHLNGTRTPKHDAPGDQGQTDQQDPS